MPTRYGIVHQGGGWWHGANLWQGNPIGARSFASWDAAEIAGLREIRESSEVWHVRILPDDVPAPLLVKAGDA